MVLINRKLISLLVFTCFFTCNPLQAATTVHSPLPGTVRQAQRIASGSGGLNTVFDAIQLGASMAAIGDLDGDGVADLAVGAPADPSDPHSSGAIWILFLQKDRRVRDFHRITSTSAGLYPSNKIGHFFGRTLTALGDLDGDGICDLAVLAPEGHRVWILFLEASGQVRSFTSIGADDPLFNGMPERGLGFGEALAPLGDIDKDGTVELCIGDSNAPADGIKRGLVWVVSLTPEGKATNVQILGDGRHGFDGKILDYDNFGGAIAPMGDITGDGNQEVAISSIYDDEGANNNGSIWILSLDNELHTVAQKKISANDPLLADDVQYGDMFSIKLTVFDDLDGDGIPELVSGSGADDDGGSSRGAVRILFLDDTLSLRKVVKISQTSGNFPGIIHNHGAFGSSIAKVGDLDGDGIAELAVGASGIGDRVVNSGGIWILGLHGVSSGKKMDTSKIMDNTNVWPQQLDLNDHPSAAPSLRSIRQW